ncbi:MAG: hypothetical protein ACETVN_04475 [Asgard group archaeon]
MITIKTSPDIITAMVSDICSGYWLAKLSNKIDNTAGASPLGTIHLIISSSSFKELLNVHALTEKMRAANRISEISTP